MPESILDLDLSNVTGIGPKPKAKLIEAGIESVLDLAAAIPGDLEEVLGGTEESASNFILSARILLETSTNPTFSL